MSWPEVGAIIAGVRPSVIESGTQSILLGDPLEVVYDRAYNSIDAYTGFAVNGVSGYNSRQLLFRDITTTIKIMMYSDRTNNAWYAQLLDGTDGSVRLIGNAVKIFDGVPGSIDMCLVRDFTFHLAFRKINNGASMLSIRTMSISEEALIKGLQVPNGLILNPAMDIENLNSSLAAGNYTIAKVSNNRSLLTYAIDTGIVTRVCSDLNGVMQSPGTKVVVSTITGAPLQHQISSDYVSDDIVVITYKNVNNYCAARTILISGITPSLTTELIPIGDTVPVALDIKKSGTVYVSAVYSVNGSAGHVYSLRLTPGTQVLVSMGVIALPYQYSQPASKGEMGLDTNKNGKTLVTSRYYAEYKDCTGAYVIADPVSVGATPTLLHWDSYEVGLTSLQVPKALYDDYFMLTRPVLNWGIKLGPVKLTATAFAYPAIKEVNAMATSRSENTAVWQTRIPKVVVTKL